MLDESKLPMLLVHSTYSPFNSTLSLRKLGQKVRAKGWRSAALVDLHSLAGSLEFIRSMEREGIAPMIGCEFWLNKATGERPDGTVTLLARDLKGYQNLCRMINLSSEQLFWTTPTINPAQLEAHNEGLLLLVGGARCRTYLACRKDSSEALNQRIDEYLESFPADDVIGTLSYIGRPDEALFNIRLVDLLSRSGITCAVTHDVCFEEEKEYIAASTIHRTGVMQFNQLPGTGGIHNRQWLITSKQCEDMFWDMSCIGVSDDRFVKPFTTRQIDRLIDGGSSAPDVKSPVDASDITTVLEEKLSEFILDNGLEDKRAQYHKRLSEELKIILSCGQARYFLFIQRLIDETKKENHLMGPGFGAMGGSLTSFLLGITEIDPIEHQLFFERFWDYSKFAKVSFHFEVAVEDRQAVLSILNKLKPQMSAAMPSQEAIDGGLLFRSVEGSVAVSKTENGSSPIRSILLQHAGKLNDIFRVQKEHSTGLIVSDYTLSDILPVSQQSGDKPLPRLQIAPCSLASNRLMEIHLHPSRQLSWIKKGWKEVAAENDSSSASSLFQIPPDDASVFRQFASDDNSIKALLVDEPYFDFVDRFKPESILELAIVSAMCRPGLDMNLPELLERKLKKTIGISPVDDDLRFADIEATLDPTYGCFVFQEQLMALMVEVGGLSNSDANSFRKALGKKMVGAIAPFSEKFIKGGLARGYQLTTLENLLNRFNEPGGYVFNKSHAMNCGLVAYLLAFLKAYHPQIFESISEERADVKGA